MAIQEQISQVGAGLTYPSTKPIASKSHMEVQVHNPLMTAPDDWTVVSISDYDLINNSAVFNSDYIIAYYDMVNVRVADTPNELANSASNIGIVVSIADEIVACATEPLYSGIIDAEENANSARIDAIRASISANSALNSSLRAEADASEIREVAVESPVTSIPNKTDGSPGDPTVVYDAISGEFSFGIPVGSTGQGIIPIGSYTVAEINAMDPVNFEAGWTFIMLDAGTITIGITPVDVIIDDWIAWGADGSFSNLGQVQGPQGIQGPAGADGVAATLDAGTTQTTAPGTDATVTNVGTSRDAVFNFTIPRGDIGPDGPDGPASTVPGPQGPTGGDGPQGEDGPAGPASTVPGPQGPGGTTSIGTTTTLASGTDATVTEAIGSIPTATIWDFGIPQGIQGPAGTGFYFQGDTTVAELNALVADPSEGFAWKMLDAGTITYGTTPATVAINDIVVWGTATTSFSNLGAVQGPEGPDGPEGPEGPTAVSADAGNNASLGTDSLIFVPTPSAGGRTPLTSNLTFTVGATGDYTEVNEAIIDMINTYYANMNATDGDCFGVTLELEAGYVFTNQIIALGINLGWITIHSTSTHSFPYASCTVEYDGTLGCFMALRGGVLPFLNLTVDLEGTSQILKYTGAYVSGGGSVRIDGGIINAPDANVVICDGTGFITGDYTGSWHRGIRATNSGALWATNCTVGGPNTYTGVYSSRGASVTAENVTINDFTKYGFHSNTSADIDIMNSTVNGSGEIGVIAEGASSVGGNNLTVNAGSSQNILIADSSIANFWLSVVGGASDAILVEHGASANFAEVTATTCTMRVTNGAKANARLMDCVSITVETGGICNVTDSTASNSQLANILTGDGIIFDGNSAQNSVTTNNALYSGSDKVINIVKLTQAEYNSATKDADTMFVIIG